MRLTIKTTVEASLKDVEAGFTQDLFLALNPPFPKVKLLQFDGCNKGDVVALELNFVFFKQVWRSDITSAREEAGLWEFIDEGVGLPFFLKSWKHRHQVVALDNGSSEIIDDITFGTGTILTDLMMYPALFGQFLYRKPIYKRYFTQKAS